MKFQYQARNKEGQIKRGEVVAISEAKAEQLLAENGFIIVSLRQQNESIFERFSPFANRVSYKDLVLFSRQLSTLISARVPILQSLRILEAQVSSPSLATITRDMITSVENGESFSLALSKHPAIFGNLYVSLVRAGEASGSVAESLNYLADQMEKDYDLRSKVRSALTYPAFIIVALFVVGFLMFKFVLPKLTEVLKEQGGQLPPISRFLINVTDLFQSYWWVILLVILIGSAAVRYYISTPSGRYTWDNLKAHVPIFGDIFQKIYLARFSRNLATLVAGGIPIIQALKIVADIISNVVYRDILLTAAEKVTNGSSISEAMSGYDEFPPIVTQMVKVGEQSAQIDTILLKLAAFYEKEVDNKIQILATLLEPAIMVVLGIGVGVLIAGILLPIYNLASTIN
jgi:type IV pilus assembly protein PilC